MKVLVTGSSGMLGKDICGILDSDNHDVFGISKESSLEMKKDRQFQGDLADHGFIDEVLEESQPDVIIHCAAIVNVDACENKRDLADEVHVRATKKLASYKPGKVGFVYISTDSVFDGTLGNYSEQDATHPLNYYSTSKLQGETVALATNPKSLIIRTNIFGFHTPPGKSLAEWAIDNLALNKTIYGFGDALFNPVYTKQLSLVICNNFLRSDLSGIWNVASKGYVSKFDFLVRLARVFNFPESLVLRNSVDDANFIAPRPKKTFLNTDKLRSSLSVVLDLQSGLEQLKTDYLSLPKSKT